MSTTSKSTHSSVKSGHGDTEENLFHGPDNIEKMSRKRIKNRIKLAAKVDEYLPNIKALESIGNLGALAEESPSHLGDDIMNKGYAALNVLLEHLASLFPNHGKDYDINDENMADLISVLGITSMTSALLPAFKKMVDVYTFLSSVIKHLKQNPIFVVLAAEYSDLTPENKQHFFPSMNQDEEHADEIRRAIIYCALLDAIAVTWTFEPTRFAATPEEVEAEAKEKGDMSCVTLTRLLSQRVDTSGWEKYCSSFEKMKTTTITPDHLLKGKSQFKAYEVKSPTSGLLLQINILEAIYQDTLLSNEDNSTAGFELMCQTYDQPKIDCIEQDATIVWEHEGNIMGIAAYRIAFPRVWSNLYSTWNACFCSQYPENIYFFAKLFCPCVIGFYQEWDKGIYIDYRVTALYMHIKFVQISRVIAQKMEFTKFSWLSDLLTVMWSRLNKKAAEAYQHRLEKTLEKEEGLYKKMSYDVTRLQHKAAYSSVTGLTKTHTNIDEGFQQVKDVYAIHQANMRKHFGGTVIDLISNVTHRSASAATDAVQAVGVVTTATVKTVEKVTTQTAQSVGNAATSTVKTIEKTTTHTVQTVVQGVTDTVNKIGHLSLSHSHGGNNSNKDTSSTSGMSTSHDDKSSNDGSN